MTTEFNYGIPVAITGKFYRVDPISGAQTLTDTTAVCRVINTTTKVELDSTVTRVSLGTYQVILDVIFCPFF